MNISTITIQHFTPGVGVHTWMLRAVEPECGCYMVRAIFNDDGSITMEIDEEETGAGRAYVTVLAVT